MTEHALAQLVRAFTRAIRAMGYYDANHPVFAATRKGAFDALRAARLNGGALTLGSSGRDLIVDAEGGRLDDQPSCTLAARMFDLGVVALGFGDSVTDEGLGILMQVLSERPERVRAAGGARALAQRRGAHGVAVFEVDFAALFAGSGVDLGALVQREPVATSALKEVLRLRQDAASSDAAISVRLDDIGGPESLGAFLDDLLQDADAEAVPGAKGHITCDDFADQAVQAFLRSQGPTEGTTQTESTLAQSAAALSAALVRLSPDARFALLRRLAGQSEDEPERDAAAARVGAQIQDNIIVSAVAAALVGQQGDPDAVLAIGDLVRRLRPIEAERRSLLESVDSDMAVAGHAIDGVLWQQMQARAYGEGGLGMLLMPQERVQAGLVQYAQQRLRGQLAAVPGQDILHTWAPPVVENWTVSTWVEVLGSSARLKDSSVATVEGWVQDLLVQGAFDESGDLLAALARRSDRPDGEAALDAVRRLLGSRFGSRWSKALLMRRDVPERLAADLLLSALDELIDPQTEDRLLTRLAQMGAQDLWSVVQRELPAAGPRRAVYLVQASFRASEDLGFKAARNALKSAPVPVKKAVIRALAHLATRDVIALLAHVAGWKGDKYTQSLLNLRGEDERHTHRLQLDAIGALGLSRNALAVRPLLELCTTAKIFSDPNVEAVQIGAAQALLTNATAEASAALDQIANHKKRGVRDIARRVLAGRR